MSDQNARSFLGIYKENLDFAALKGDARIPAVQSPSVQETQEEIDPPPAVKIGDFVQWTSNGADQFKPPKQVTWVSPDGAYLRVFGSPTGIPMTEVSIENAPTGQPRKAAPSNGGETPKKSEINVYHTGGRLQITADVDLEGIQKLRDALLKYEEILKLLN